MLDNDARPVGPLFAIPVNNLMTHLRCRGEYHRDRAAEKEKQLPDLKSLLEATSKTRSEYAPQFSNKTNYRLDSNDTVEALESDIQIHKHKSAKFLFLADHVVEGNPYYLTINELTALEMIPSC